MHPIIALWTHPRSISTAFERIMIERKDFTVLHEPFSYYYYVHKDQSSIAQEYVDSDHPTAFPEIRDMIIETREKSPVFFKDMCAHCFEPLVQDTAFLKQMVNTFLIRNPERAIPSFYAMNKDVTLAEIGLEQVNQIFLKIWELTGKTPIVVDATDLENDPDGIMAAYCRALDIPFIQDAMTWEQGHQDKWDIWENWHTDAARSTGIQKDMEVFDTDIHNNDHLKQFFDHQFPFYELLHQHRIRPVSI